MKVAQSCMTLCSVHVRPWTVAHQPGMLQARILEWVAIHFSRASSQPRNQTQVSCILYHLSRQHLVNCQWSWAPAHLLYQRSILSTQCAGKYPDHLVGFHASPLCGCMAKNRSMLAPRVMVRGLNIIIQTARRGSKSTHCHWFPWKNHLIFRDLVCSVFLSSKNFLSPVVSVVWVCEAKPGTLASPWGCVMRFCTGKRKPQ